MCFEGRIRFFQRGIFCYINYLGSMGFVEGCYKVIKLGEVEVTPLMANWALASANQTRALSVQNSGSLTVTALTSKEAAATGSGLSDILKTKDRFW